MAAMEKEKQDLLQNEVDALPQHRDPAKGKSLERLACSGSERYRNCRDQLGAGNVRDKSLRESSERPKTNRSTARSNTFREQDHFSIDEEEVLMEEDTPKDLIYQPAESVRQYTSDSSDLSWKPRHWRDLREELNRRATPSTSRIIPTVSQLDDLNNLLNECARSRALEAQKLKEPNVELPIQVMKETF